MERKTWHIEIRCSGCRFATMYDAAALARWLQAEGRLRRDSESTGEEMRELGLALAPQIPCSSCGQLQLSALLIEDDPNDWPEARRCEDCGALIPPERLEVFPDVRVCTNCQSREERGLSPDAPEYCPGCGAPMTLRLSGGAGIRRYVMICSATPPCRQGGKNA